MLFVVIRVQHPGCAQQFHVAQPDRFGLKAGENSPRRVVGPDHLRPRRELERDGERGRDAFGNGVAQREVKDANVVDDLAAFGLALFLLFILIGGGILPLSHLPAPIAAIAQILPAAALTQALQASMTSSAVFPTFALIVLAVWAVLILLVAIRMFKWE